MTYHTTFWELHLDSGNKIDVIFVKKKDLVAYANENEITNYTVVKRSMR